MPEPTERSVYQIGQVFNIQGFELIGNDENNMQTVDLLANAQLTKVQNNPDQLLNMLIRSFAPSIYGNEMPKLACLCSLVGGVPMKQTQDISIRENINLLLIGDPGVSKSQLLKFISATSTRGIYISGRGASGAGLTAAIMRLPGQAEFTLEPGALILSDRGVCCIDEFDKILEQDRTAIYEVLEQQTISISKAGINASLNARTTVCAAANPKYSKWDPTKSLKENIDLPEALISRFDVVFVMRDFVDVDRDERLGAFVGAEHGRPQEFSQANASAKVENASGQPPLKLNELRQYLSECSELQPQLKAELVSQYVESYVSDRQEKDMTTPRAALALIRLSQAIAKLRRSQFVEKFDIDMARQLVKASEESAESQMLGRVERPQRKQQSGASGILRQIVREYGSLPQQELIQKAVGRGVVAGDAQKALQKLLELGMLDKDGDHISEMM